MRQSQLFLKTRKDFPKDEVAINAQLLIRGGFVEKIMSGVYAFLPLGFRVRDRVMSIIREEMDKLGAEMLMPALHPRALWEVTGRWKKMESIMYQFKDHSGKEVGLGPTHEEVIALIAKPIIESYSDLPLAVYQIQTKFRDEARAKSGLLRGREFTMKDLYSFHADAASLDVYYNEVKKGYLNVFSRCGLRAFVTEASGGDFSKEYSHEFMVAADAGEDTTYLCRLCGFAQNKEISKAKKGSSCPGCKDGVIEEVKTIEVGNIFKLGTRFSEPVKLLFRDEKGGMKPVIMASYGIGVERLMGTIVESSHDDRGIVWPEAVAPFRVHLLGIDGEDKDVSGFCKKIYDRFLKDGVEVLYDDRKGVSPGEKFFDADLIGIPWRVVVSPKTYAHEKIEVKRRNEKDVALLKVDEFLKIIKK
jgi:prolyl-tRNA synthetase